MPSTTATSAPMTCDKLFYEYSSRAEKHAALLRAETCRAGLGEDYFVHETFNTDGDENKGHYVVLKNDSVVSHLWRNLQRWYQAG